MGGGRGCTRADTSRGKQKRAVEETKAIFGPLRERIAGAVERVEGLLVVGFSCFRRILR